MILVVPLVESVCVVHASVLRILLGATSIAAIERRRQTPLGVLKGGLGQGGSRPRRHPRSHRLLIPSLASMPPVKCDSPNRIFRSLRVYKQLSSALNNEYRPSR